MKSLISKTDTITNSPATLEPLQSVHTTNFPDILNRLGISLISTYQAEKVVLMADPKYPFPFVPKPMGLATDNEGRMAISTGSQIWKFRNVSAVAPNLEPTGKHGAWFLPRNMHVIDDIDIHEMAWGQDELCL